MRLHHQIRTADGTPVHTGEPDSTLLYLFMGRHKQTGCRVVWGDHRRVMKRRKDGPEVVAKCRCGERLIDLTQTQQA